jgi:hypothetical protein
MNNPPPSARLESIRMRAASTFIAILLRPRPCPESGGPDASILGVIGGDPVEDFGRVDG